MSILQILPKYIRELDNADVRNKCWREFYRIKEAYNLVRPAYALTIHKSQGSTFGYVFVDFKDVERKCRDGVVRNRLGYVGLTRASTKACILT